MLEATEIVKRGFLCVLDISCWGNSKVIKKQKVDQLSKIEWSKWTSHSKKLIDKKALEDINTCILKVKSRVKYYALPFPINRVHLIPKEHIATLSAELDELINTLSILVDSFADQYNEHIVKAREELGEELFNYEDYPEDIRSKFSINYQFIDIGVPGEFQSISPELYAKEMEKFKNMMESARNECVLFLREGFIKELNDIVSSLTGVNEDGSVKKVRSDTIAKVEKFFDIFKSKNLFEDQELLKEIEKARNIMLGIEATDLRNSEKLKELIANQISGVAETVQQGIIKYRRKVKLGGGNATKDNN